MLNGVEKVTYDVDVLTRDHKTFQHITDVLHQIGMKPIAATEGFSSFIIDSLDQDDIKKLTLDLLCIRSELLRPLKGVWTTLEEKRIDGSTLPVASPVHLILLKVLVNSRRQAGDKKIEQDLVDVRQLMSIRDITPERVKDEARRQGLVEETTRFLNKLKASNPS